MMNKYSFDGQHIGKLRDSGRSLGTREVRRPPRISDTHWYTLAEQVCGIINDALADKEQAPCGDGVVGD